jgi:asparagine N-glycosylation enzyme membrane subunit Stt3
MGKVIEYKKILKWSIIILFIILIIGGVWLRTLNLNLLKDSTSGKYIPLALDPFYFLRISKTIVSTGGLPETDTMRYPSIGVGFSNEIMPNVVVLMYNFASVFDKDVDLGYINVISPVIFFVLGIIVFFFLIYYLTKSKSTALISSVFLTLIPSYLHRTMAGFSDHESIGMFAFFLVLLVYAAGIKFIANYKNKHQNIISSLAGLIVGFFAAFSIACWGGGARFVLCK